MSTSTERFTTNCPSCDAGVAVKAALVGKKIECPKCKFRFVVPAPAGEAPAAAPAKADKPGKSKSAATALADGAKGDPKGGKEKKEGKTKGGKEKKKEAKGGGNGKVIVGAVVGVIALVGLAFGAFLIFSKVNSNKETEAQNKIQQQKNNAINNGGDGGGTPPTQPGTPGGGNTDGDPMTPGGGAIDPMTPGGGNTGTTPAPTPPKPKPKKPRGTGVDITNLLPGDTTAVFHARMDDLESDARPLRGVVFDKVTTDLFERAMNFHPDQITELVQGEVGAARAPFAVFRTKTALDEALFAQPKMDTSTAETIQKWQYRVVNRNAFLTAAEKSLGVTTILGPLLGFDIPTADPGPAKDVTYAVCLYDANTLIVAERDLMQRYLGDLKENGYPEFKTIYKEVEVAPPAPSADGGGQPGSPGGPEARPGGPPMPMGAGGQPMPGGPDTPGGPASPAPPKPRKTLTGNPTFLTVAKDLKKALNALEDEEKDLPAAVYVTRVNSAQVNLLDPRTLLKPETLLALTALREFKVIGVAVTRVTEKRGSFAGYIEYASADAAKTSVEQQLIPGLKLLLAAQLPAKLLPVVVRDLDDPNSNPSNPGGGYPGGEGPGYPGPGGSPGYPGPGGGGAAPLAPPPSPGGPGGRGSPGGPGGGGRGSEASAPRQQGGSGDDNAQGPRGGRGAQEGPSQQPPGGPGGPGYPGPGGPGYPGGDGSGPGTQPAQPGGNVIGVSRDGAVVTLTGEFNWKEDVFATAVEPIFARHGAVVRGKMGMYSGEAGLFALAAKPKDGKPAGGVTAEAFGKEATLPQGALARAARSDDRKLPGTTAGLPYQPEQRCSFFAELTKYMDNKGGLHRNIDRDQAWYQKPNLELAETWIPELLVPDYPQTAWRATSELIPDGRSVGATNFVGVAGVGMDAARLNPKNPDDAKKAGMTGYDFASKPEDVTDGLSNTIYLIQVPPTYQRPWMAGGGATLQGVNDKGNDPARPFMVKKGDGSRGTMVLMGDGSVRAIKEGVDPAAFRAMATRAGGETIADLDKLAPPARSNLPGELKAGK